MSTSTKKKTSKEPVKKVKMVSKKTEIKEEKKNDIENENSKEIEIDAIKEQIKEEKKKSKKTKKKLKKKPIIILLLIIVLSIGAFFVTREVLKSINGESKYLKLELNGEEEIKLKYNTEYTDLGAVASYQDEDLTNDIEVSNDLDIEHVGTYSYTYKVKYKKVSKEIKRTIIVYDDEKPTMKLNGREELSMVVGNEFKDEGAVASDLYDGDLTEKIEIDKSGLDTNTVGKYEVNYIVKDSSGNETTLKRVVNVVEKAATKIPVLNYHFFYDNKSEGCNENICLRMDRFRQQLDYLRDNGFYTVTIHEFVSWMYGEIELPQKSVLLTVDDGAFGTSKVRGNYLIPALEEYKMYATLFLITDWWPIENYESDYLDVQSHTHDLHYEAKCGHRSKVNCVSYDELVSDLKKSIDVVKDTSSFCFPFYDYTESSIKAVQEVGFKVAFIGGDRKASRSDNKYKIPRYPIYDSTSLSTFKSIVN